MDLKSKFEGGGRASLVDALRRQQIVHHDEGLANALVDAGELRVFAAGELLAEQGSNDNHVLFLIVGEVDVLVNGRALVVRRAGVSIGEMALVSPTAQRSATVVARKETLALAVEQGPFLSTAAAFPTVWRPIAEVIAERLRERERFHRAPNPSPVLFLGTSVEGLPVANEIVSGLKHDDVIARPWAMPGLFSPGGVSVDVLLKEVDGADFAAMVFGPDDRIASRTATYAVPRDNVVFELGLFMGRIGRDRALMVLESKTDVKIPSDLLGITPITYVMKGGDLAASVQTVCGDLRAVIKRLGTR